MKKFTGLFLHLFLSLLLFFPKEQLAQFNVDLIVFEPLPEIDFAAFASVNDLAGAPRISQVTMNPQGQTVVATVGIDWKKPGESSFRYLFSFTTEPFSARSFFNNEVGNSDIRIDDSDANDDLTDELLKIGKPNGSFIITVIIKDENNVELDRDEKRLDFTNPAQTLTIRSPDIGSIQDIGGVLAEWDEVIGASSYKIRANIRRNANQSLEEALNTGNPIIDDKDVGLVTSVNLRNYLDREWLPGQEIVLQVSAQIPGPGGGDELFSQPVNFFFNNANDPQQEQIQNLLTNLFQNLGDSQSGGLLSLIQSGDIDFSDVRITDEDGKILSISELQSLINYLQTNPDALINLSFQPR